MRTDFVLDALEQALYARQPELGTLAHHSDRGSPGLITSAYWNTSAIYPPAEAEAQYYRQLAMAADAV